MRPNKLLRLCFLDTEEERGQRNKQFRNNEGDEKKCNEEVKDQV